MKKHIGKDLVVAHCSNRRLEATLELLTDAADRQRQKKIHADHLAWISVGQLSLGTVVFDDPRFVVQQNCANWQVIKLGLSQLVNRVHDVVTVNLKEVFVFF